MDAATTGTATVPLRVAFQGEPGAFSEEAAICRLGDAIVTVPCATFDALFASIPSGAADCFLAPIENTLAGAIAPVCDLLWNCSLTIQAEIVHPIRHCLIGAPGATLQTIQTVQSHPAALAQCENYFRSCPEVRRVGAEDTAGSVREIVAMDDPSRGAIASRRAAQMYGGTILLDGLEDNPRNFTRFLLFGAGQVPGLPVSDRSAQKMTLLLQLSHQSGSLHRALGVFARRNMNLLKIESRPIAGEPWHYRFFLDIAVNVSRAENAEALEELRRESVEFRCLGIYAAGEAVARSGASAGPQATARGAA